MISVSSSQIMPTDRRSKTTLLGKLRTAWTMPTPMRNTALHALCVTPFVEVALRWFSLPTVCEWLGVAVMETAARATPTEESPEPEPIGVSIRRAQRATEIALRTWGYPRNCLRRALLTGYLLRKHKPSLHIGVRRQNDRCEAHAWLDIAETRVDASNSTADFHELARPWPRSKRGSSVDTTLDITLDP